jgi:CheY-like chemotaxis protein/predicted regulator of Ras-like GTPase activity (Roadblock/LC7/MglB family)
MASQILIVDDEREITRMLRAALELIDRNYKIVEVPSAEEAMLEIRRTAFDLVIVDVRLPGMDGLELTRRIRKARPDAQIAIITGNSNPRTEAEARKLNPVAYLTKPLDQKEFAAVIQKVLGGKMPDFAPGEAPPPPSVADRLSALRRDLGCMAVYLADLDGLVIARAGDVSAFGIEEMVRHIEVAFSASLKVCHLLGGLVPLNMHFFDGDDYDVYVINVGQSFMLIMLFGGEMGAKQMGLVLRYGRQCADDLLNVMAERVPLPLPYEQPAPLPVEAAPVTETIIIPIPEAEPIVLPSPHLPVPEPEPALPVLDIRTDVLDAAATSLNELDLDSFWDEAVSEVESAATRGSALSFEQALKLGLVPKEEQK